MAENAETIPENANNGEQSESIEPVAAPTRKPAEPAKSLPEEPEPKKRGRPSGAKDREPRRKKLIIVEEPVSEPNRRQRSLKNLVLQQLQQLLSQWCMREKS